MFTQVVELIQFLDIFVPLCGSPFSYCCSCPHVLFGSCARVSRLSCSPSVVGEGRLPEGSGRD